MRRCEASTTPPSHCQAPGPQKRETVNADCIQLLWLGDVCYTVVRNCHHGQGFSLECRQAHVAPKLWPPRPRERPLLSTERLIPHDPTRCAAGVYPVPRTQRLEIRSDGWLGVNSLLFRWPDSPLPAAAQGGGMPTAKAGLACYPRPSTRVFFLMVLLHRQSQKGSSPDRYGFSNGLRSRDGQLPRRVVLCSADQAR